MRDFRPRGGTAILAAAAALLAGTARADTGTVIRANNYFGIGAGVTHLGYGETLAGQPGYLDTENGNLPTVKFELGSMRDALGVSNLYEHIELSYANGQTTYNGAVTNLLTGASFPVTNQSDAEILAGRVALGKGFVLAEGLMLTPHLDLGGRYWRRNLNGGDPPGYEELYSHWFYGAGLKADYSPVPRLTLSVDGAVRRNFESRMEASIEEAPFKLGNRGNYFLSGRVDYRLAGGVSLFAETALERFKYGRSSVHASGFFEPDSSTNQITYLGGVAFGF